MSFLEDTSPSHFPVRETGESTDGSGTGFRANLPAHYRWNFIVLAGDASAWFFALAFMDVVTVLPIFFQRMDEALARSFGMPLPFVLRASFLAGLALAIRTAGWLVPQFFSARRVSASSWKKPLLLKACWISRTPFLLLTFYLLFGHAAAHPLLSILLALFTWTVFSIGEGYAGVPWTDIIARAIPDRRRGRLFSAMQITGGILACGAGPVVTYFLGPAALAFPRNFAILFGLMFLLLMVSQTFLMLIREPAGTAVEREPPPMREYLRQMPTLVREGGSFRRLITVQLLGSIGSASAPLYTLFATQRLHVPEAAVGRYLSAAMAGSVLGSLIWGLANDHWGPRRVIRLNLVVSVLGPWSALAAAVWIARTGAAPGLAGWLFCLPFLLNGMAAAGSFTGYTNYLLETAPEARRPEYIGLMNTLVAPGVVLPLLGTGLAGLFSTPFVFMLSGIGCLAALIVSQGLSASRQEQIPPSG